MGGLLPKFLVLLWPSATALDRGKRTAELRKDRLYIAQKEDQNSTGDLVFDLNEWVRIGWIVCRVPCLLNKALGSLHPIRDAIHMRQLLEYSNGFLGQILRQPIQQLRPGLITFEQLITHVSSSDVLRPRFLRNEAPSLSYRIA